ncbi:uncharacterized protein LY79DRAFT_518029 [Colletotrichum navitas]|uniref:Uncharacterized protein n=1 Tax=Colletotrichum navitas TaxID=681940 RepID=A0AAD8PY48_9PEZI|nr:uncharacterized protein LY79DRAFT_518029 [Colletotrichum navitas]KAK1585888.1 hypothetical protein LY79DRAFT_518029 [Colletotrichum navitas]
MPTMATPCVSQRCGLCGFKLQDNDDIVAIMHDGQQSKTMTNKPSILEEFEFIECVGACPHLGGQATGCHIACANHVPSALRVSLLRALAYQYEPSPSELAARIRWLRLQFATSPILRRAEPHLPQELRYHIAKYLLQGPSLHRYAMAYAQTLPKMESGSSLIRVSARIWARFIDFEGVRYFSSMSNSCDNHHTELVFTPDPSRRVESVYVAENYLGVVQVIFCCSDQPPVVERCQGIWWRVIRLHDDLMLITQTDSQGVKLRSLALRNEESNLHLNHLWCIPPSEPVRLVQLDQGPPAAQISMLECNKPRVTAYSVYWYCRIMLIHAHVAGEKLAFYQGHDKGVWVYFALEQGEKISQIWMYSQFKRGSVLIFRTTHSRVACFGPQPKLQPLPIPTLIDVPRQDRGSRLFWEHSPLGVRNLFFETSVPAPASESLALPRPSSQHPRSTFFESYFYSTATLDGVRRIVPCQRYIHGKLRIIGLLLQFPGGRQSCVGQVRLDSLGNHLQADGNQSIWLGFSKDDHRPFVSALELSEPKQSEGLSWLEVQLCGTLEWWFSSRQCQVCYMGKSSPPTRL